MQVPGIILMIAEVLTWSKALMSTCALHLSSSTIKFASVIQIHE
jgi:hypothetical protein